MGIMEKMRVANKISVEQLNELKGIYSIPVDSLLSLSSEKKTSISQTIKAIARYDGALAWGFLHFFELALTTKEAARLWGQVSKYTTQNAENLESLNNFLGY